MMHRLLPTSVKKKAGKPESRIYRVFSHISDGEFVPPKKPELPCKIVILRCDCGNYTVIPQVARRKAGIT